MMSRIAPCIAMLAVFAVLNAAHPAAEQNGPPHRGRPEPARYESVDYGGGTIYEMELIGDDLMETNIYSIRRGIIPARAGIGLHRHEKMEEMYIVLDGAAEFTVDGHTSLLPAKSSVLCPLGSSHALYNNSDETLEFITIAVAVEKGVADENIVYGPVPGRKGMEDGKISMASNSSRPVVIESPPKFRYARFDASLTKWVGPAHKGAGKILNRRPWLDGNFETNWVRIGHCILPPGTSIGYHQHNGIEEVYCIIGGRGRSTVNDVTWDARAGDAIPCTLHDSHGIYNDSDGDLDLFVVMAAMEPGKLDSNDHGDDLSSR